MHRRVKLSNRHFAITSRFLDFKVDPGRLQKPKERGERILDVLNDLGIFGFVGHVGDFLKPADIAQHRLIDIDGGSTDDDLMLS